MAIEVLAPLLAATFAGALVQAATGFGFAIVAAPAFLALTNAKSAIVVLIALHLVQSFMVVPKALAKASRWHLKWMVAGAVPGALGGVALFYAVSVTTLKVLAGVTILVMLVLIAIRERRAAMQGRSARSRPHGVPATLIAGGTAAAMNALLVMPGPPLMIYFMGDRLSGGAVRALSLTFFGLCYAALTVYHAIVGSFSAADLTTIAGLAPAVVIGTLCGNALVPHLPEQGLRIAILVLLMLTGLGALASAALG
jgi:uncharacterized membrane protein YfcA